MTAPLTSAEAERRIAEIEVALAWPGLLTLATFMQLRRKRDTLRATLKTLESDHG